MSMTNKLRLSSGERAGMLPGVCFQAPVRFTRSIKCSGSVSLSGRVCGFWLGSTCVKGMIDTMSLQDPRLDSRTRGSRRLSRFPQWLPGSVETGRHTKPEQAEVARANKNFLPQSRVGVP